MARLIQFLLFILMVISCGLSLCLEPHTSYAQEMSAEANLSEPVNFTYPDYDTHSDDIERWCKNDSHEVRFTTVGIVPNGYERCGVLRTQAYCDPLGNKIYSQSSDVPHGYKKCGGEPRIYMEKNGKVVDIKAAMNGTGEYATETVSEDSAQDESKLDGYFSELDSLMSGEKGSKFNAKKSVRASHRGQAAKQHAQVDKAMQQLTGVLDAFGLTQNGQGGASHSEILQEIDLGELQKNLHNYLEAYTLPEDFFDD